MMHQLQDPDHIVPSIIVGLLLSCGWEVAYNEDQEPYIRHTKHLTTYSTWWEGPYIWHTKHLTTYSTWWECLAAVIHHASHTE